ncbi:MAG: type II secretion system F family protein [Planctomycetaceae bacterium]|nr:MAG: type II secretion system F family protein [Planctomycetaceae bacterium]
MVSGADMTRFQYQVRDGSGRTDAGVLTAESIDDASRMLRKDGKIILGLREDHAKAAAAATAGPRKAVKREDVIFLCTQLAVMVDTGVPLSEALDSIADQTLHTGMKAMVSDISDMVKSGTEFSVALEKYQKTFGRLFIAMMKASEASGTMGSMLQRVSEYLQQERETINRIKGAMTYPICMLSFCILVVVSLLVFVLPRFEKIYEGKGAALPLPTQILLSMSKGVVNYWPYILVCLAGVVVGAYYYFRSPAGRMMLDLARINLPIIGPMYRKAYLARSLRTMATMITTGVSMLEGLEISARVAGNYFYTKVWTDVADRVKEGSTLSEQLFQCKLIPRTVTQMISAGEKTGKLGTVMNRVASFCEEDLSIAVKTVTNMIEPIMIIVMGALVGGIAMALLLPIFSISKVVAH